MKKLFSAPGRIEIGGNHTDHQLGRVLAAAVDLVTKCTAEANGTDIVHITDDRFSDAEVDLRSLEVNEEEKGISKALIRGVAAWFQKHGYAIGGFDAHVSSDIPAGSGLSSSAAFEVMIGKVFKGLFDAEISPIEIAIAGQFAENVYFGKPSGMMDQVASSFGGLSMIDFQDPLLPVITPIHAGFSGYTICVVSTGGSHADLTQDYATVRNEMKTVAAYFDKEYLREVSPDQFYTEIGRLRPLGDRAVLRAFHFFEENKRVSKQADALEKGRISEFFDLVIESGRSSMDYLQNIYNLSHPQQQGLTLALALSEKLLSGQGAWRVHGGGFAGTILAFVPNSLREIYNKQMCEVFGEGCCLLLNIQ